MHLVYYDELDPFRGGIRPEMEDLPTLIADLALLLSRYDTVLLPTEALAGHPLALPALEHFADFVHSGRLTVSAPPLSPSAYLRSQVETPYFTTAQKRPHSSPRAVAHQQQTNEARRRWESVTPSRWTVAHDPVLQQQTFRERLTKYLETTESPTDATNHLLAVMDTASMQGVELSRGTLLASLAAVRNYVAPRDIAPAAALMHIADLHAIAESHAGACESFTFFPGPWARAMREHPALLRDAALPHFDWELTALGRDVLHKQLAGSPSRTLQGPCARPAAWSLSLGPNGVLPAVQRTTELDGILDMATLLLHVGKRHVQLTLTEARLLSAVVNGGDLGLDLAALIQMTAEQDALGHAAEPAKKKIPTVMIRSNAHREAIVKRVHTTCARIRAKVRKVDLRLPWDDGRLYLTRSDGQRAKIRQAPSLWTMAAQTDDVTVQAGLARRERKLLRALARWRPHHLGMDGILRAAGLPSNDASIKVAIDSLTRIDDALLAERHVLRLHRAQKGVYLLARPRNAA